MSSTEATEGGKERYGLGFGSPGETYVIYMNDDSGNTKNAEAWFNKPISHTFYIEQDGPNHYQIGFRNATTLCPMFMNRAVHGDSQYNAEFRCDQKIGDKFWFKQGELLWRKLLIILSIILSIINNLIGTILKKW